MSSRSWVSFDVDDLSRSSRERLERLFSFDHGPEYPHEHPPGYAETIDRPLPIELDEFEEGPS